MNRAEAWGVELAVLVRREHDQVQELAETRGRIEVLTDRIRREPTETLYGPNTGEFAAVQLSRPAHAENAGHFQAEASPGWANAAPDETIIVEMPTEVGMSALVKCPRADGGECWEPMVHVHTADGRLHPLPVGHRQ